MPSKFTMPAFYQTIGNIAGFPLTGLPLNWRNEVSGVLPAAVHAYLNNRIDGAPLDEIQFEIVRSYLEHYIQAPCWNHMNEDGELTACLAALRRDVLTLRTPQEIGVWISGCMDIGIDPL